MAGMKPGERLWAAIRLEKPDRVPIVPSLLPEPAAHLTGVSLAEVAADNRVALKAILQVFDEYGGWDAVYPGTYTPLQLQASNVNQMKVKIPGRDLPDDYMWQLLEEEILKPEDYEKISEMGIDRFYYEDYLFRISDLTTEEASKEIEALVTTFISFLEGCTARGVQPFFMGNSIHPFFTLSLMRSMVPFTQDLYYKPEPVERAMKRMTADLIATQLPLAKDSGLGTWLFTEERACGFFYPPAVFERFWWPYTREVVDAFWSEGIVTIFHLDQCWDKNISYFKQLPRGSAILELDSKTDMVRAKHILQNHLCFHGDLPASLLVLGKPEEVAAYCRTLIDEVGADGGLILGSGCSVPCNVEPANFRAMLETGRNHRPGG